MLFDLRSRGRRRVVKSVYLFLAVLIGVGLVGFGVGTGGNFGGLLSAAGNSGSGSGGTAGAALVKQLTKAQRKAKAKPNDPALWADVGTDAYAVATLPSYYDSTVGFTATGHRYLATMKQAWTKYLALAPSSPNTSFASQVAEAFGETPTGIEDWPTAEAAQEVVVTSQPKSYTAYYYLALYAYEAKDKTAGDLAAAKAIALAPKSEVKTLTTDLAELRAETVGATGASGASGTTGAT